MDYKFVPASSGTLICWQCSDGYSLSADSLSCAIDASLDTNCAVGTNVGGKKCVKCKNNTVLKADGTCGGKCSDVL
jgi:hypothetical protein